ncbi:hypothetical protein CYLTODRAFT_419732 [Cylindrobasidium torrendii FP15055 ss-10]|uniref:Family A G protein-coupled receptor-like protein n=1 Tax=Cylindrobasidium torrendii FP15055 ss-10 TaxID=1314674 RepID=A0A0D7BIX2_9AGAR|nr:hypothetical protein CYLTODRAFT_419732 [Cylindrobasidium torrendii FP15055 ss-10]
MPGAMSVSLPVANLASIICEALCYGAFTVLFVAAAWVMLSQRKRKPLNVTLLTTVTVLWILSTTHLVLDGIRLFSAFLGDQTPEEYYLTLSNPLQVAKTAVYATMTLVGDAFVIYRVYIVWNRNWWIVLMPLFLLAGTGVAGYGATYMFTKATPGSPVFEGSFKSWVTSFIAFTLITNISCTFIIALRIMNIQRGVKRSATQQAAKMPVHSVLTMLLESAAIYSVSVLVFMITYVCESNSQYIILDMISPIIGITFTFIILRVSLGISSRELVTGGDVSHTAGSGFELSNHNNTIRQPVAISVSHIVDVDIDGNTSPYTTKNRNSYDNANYDP